VHAHTHYGWAAKGPSAPDQRDPVVTDERACSGCLDGMGELMTGAAPVGLARCPVALRSKAAGAQNLERARAGTPAQDTIAALASMMVSAWGANRSGAKDKPPLARRRAARWRRRRPSSPGPGSRPRTQREVWGKPGTGGADLDPRHACMHGKLAALRAPPSGWAQALSAFPLCAGWSQQVRRQVLWKGASVPSKARLDSSFATPKEQLGRPRDTPRLGLVRAALAPHQPRTAPAPSFSRAGGRETRGSARGAAKSSTARARASKAPGGRAPRIGRVCTPRGPLPRSVLFVARYQALHSCRTPHPRVNPRLNNGPHNDDRQEGCGIECLWAHHGVPAQGRGGLCARRRPGWRPALRDPASPSLGPLATAHPPVAPQPCAVVPAATTKKSPAAKKKVCACARGARASPTAAAPHLVRRQRRQPRPSSAAPPATARPAPRATTVPAAAPQQPPCPSPLPSPNIGARRGRARRGRARRRARAGARRRGGGA
jgi:hypothetical protein